MTIWQRWGKATKATLVGWALAFAAASLVQIVIVLRDSGHDFQLVLAALGYSFAVWLLLTFTGVLLVWFCVVSPVAIFLSGEWLVRHRMLAMATSFVLGLLIVACAGYFWRHLSHGGAGLLNFWTGACFVFVFPVVTAHYYLRFLTRALPA